MSDETRIPTKEELAALPRWACVAFAARCARLVQPLFKAGWPDAPEEHIRSVDKAIEVAEQAAANATSADADADAAAAAVDDAVDDATDAAAEAATAADTAAEAATASEAYSAVYAAAAAAARAAAAAGVVKAAIMYDFERLNEYTRREGWTDETPVPPEFFGPIWPEGEPAEWQELLRTLETSARRERDQTPQREATPGDTSPPAIALVWDPELLDEDDYAELVAALGDLVRAEGGAGLKRVQSRGFGVSVEAGVFA